MGFIKTIKRTRKFGLWLANFQDSVTRAVIAQRIERLRHGLGDCKSVGDGVRELRIDVGPGWRVYFTEVQGQIILLLAGGSKKTQQADINDAKEMARTIKSKLVRTQR